MDGRGGAVDSSADENNVYRPLYISIRLKLGEIKSVIFFTPNPYTQSDSYIGT